MKGQRLASVVLVGRPNVGKSTLFNQLTGTRRAIVTPLPGTTRDVNAHPVVWLGHQFELVDTGGMFGHSADPLQAQVVEQGRRALAAADLVVLVVDGREGLVPADQEVAAAVRASGRPALVAINKMDDRRAKAGALDLYRLGFDPVIEVSAEHAQGVGDLLDEVLRRLPPGRTTARDESSDGAAEGAAGQVSRELGIVFVGRPNAGKSSLVNRLLKEERMIVSEVAGTTRDPVDSVLTWHRRQFRIVDTAGIRKAGKVARGGTVENVSVMLAKRAIAQADVAVLVMDAPVGPTDQDAAIAGAAHEAGCAVVIAANKWDLMKGEGQDTAKRFDEQVRFALKFLPYAPILHISAQTGERAPKLLEAIDRVAQARFTRVSTGELNRFIERVTLQHPPVSSGHRRVRILYAAQTAVAPPTFVLFTNVASSLHFSYERFLENRLRDEFGFEGSPLRLVVRRRDRRSASGGQ